MILIDDRAGSKDLVKLFPPELVRQHRLEAGDAAWFGHGPEGPFTFPIGLEYKTVGDAVTCMINRRFVGTQFQNMSRLYKRIVLLIEGEYREGPDGKLLVPQWFKGKLNWVSHGWSITYRQFDNWQNSLTETGKVVIKRSLTQYESAAQVLDLYYMWTKDYDQHKSLFAFDSSQQPPMIEEPTLVRLMAAQIPHIGWKRSKDVAATFKHPHDMFMASEEQWREIPGIGKTLARQIVQALHMTLSQNSQPTLPSVQSTSKKGKVASVTPAHVN